MPAETVKDRRIGAFPRSRREEGREPGWDLRLTELAREQHGVVARRQLRELGLEKDAIQHRIASGRLHPLHAGVYAVGHRLVPKEGWWMAAVLASGPEAVLSHRSAATLWMLRGYSGGAVHVTLPSKSTSSKVICRHHSPLPADEVTTRHGIPVTTVPRTIFDLSATEPVDVVKSLLRESEYRQLYDRLSLWDLLDRYPGKRGARRVRAVLKQIKEEPSGYKRSRLEERFAPFLRQRRLPLPRFNDWITLNGKRYQVDCHWPGTHQIVELDGWDGHSTRTAFREDRARDRALSVAGYTVTRITWNQLDDEPEEVAADLRALLLIDSEAGCLLGDRS